MYDYAKINQNGDKRHYDDMNIIRYSLIFIILFIGGSQIRVTHLTCEIIKRGGSSRWSFGPNSAWDGTETTTIGNTYPTLF